MDKRRFWLALAIVGCVLLTIFALGATHSWQRGALLSGMGVLLVILVFFAAMLINATNWRADLSMCLMLSALPAVGVAWGAGAIFPFATMTGLILLAVGFVGSVFHRQFLVASGCSLLCVLGALVLTIVTLIDGFRPNVLAACLLMLLSMALYVTGLWLSGDGGRFGTISYGHAGRVPYERAGMVCWGIEIGGRCHLCCRVLRRISLVCLADQEGHADRLALVNA